LLVVLFVGATGWLAGRGPGDRPQDGVVALRKEKSPDAAPKDKAERAEKELAQQQGQLGAQKQWDGLEKWKEGIAKNAKAADDEKADPAAKAGEVPPVAAAPGGATGPDQLAPKAQAGLEKAKVALGKESPSPSKEDKTALLAEEVQQRNVMLRDQAMLEQRLKVLRVAPTGAHGKDGQAVAPGFFMPPGQDVAKGGGGGRGANFPNGQGNFNGGLAGGIGGFGGGLAGGGQGFGGPGPVPGGGLGGGFGAVPGGPAADMAQATYEREMRRQGNFDYAAAYRLDPNRPVLAPMEPLVTREYAYRHQGGPGNTRSDFAETVYWQPALVLADGKGKVAFDLPDSATRFEVVAWGHTLDGRLGAAKLEIASRLPFSVEAKVPTEVTHTDKVIIPVSVANDTDKERTVRVEARANKLTLAGSATRSLAVGPEQRRRQLFVYHPSAVEGQATVAFNGVFGSAEKDRDGVVRTFNVVPEGFPFVGAHSDLLEKSAQHDIELPKDVVAGTVRLKAQVFPSTLADLQKGLEALLREPNGCFEQTSSSNYPNVLILSYLKESDLSKPEIENRARQLLASGYQKLISFECTDPQDRNRRGYEWFGGTAPAHEALTAYGLLEFRDMARVQSVDADMIERTRKYLLDQRDGRGGFKRNPRALDSFGRAPEHLTNAYIVWALTEAGDRDNLDTELKALVGRAKDSTDPYFLSLVGNSLLNRGRTAEALDILKGLTKLQQPDGHLAGAQTSITNSGGRDLQIETTALATLAWLKANRPADFRANIDKATKWIGQQRGGYGGFGSTQSTILALKALIAYTKDNKKTAEGGELRLFVGGGAAPVAVQPFAAGTQEPIVVSLPEKHLLPAGKHTVRLEITGKNYFPYTLSWTYNRRTPDNPANCPVHLTSRLDRKAAAEGETVRLSATVENKSGQDQGMAVAILGLPGGLALPEDMKQLKEMTRLRDNDTKPGLISAWELRGRELVLYWRSLGKDQKIDVTLDLICRVPGEYRGPASRAYLYYNNERKHWVEPLAIDVQPKAE
jgi:hypothetical protein